MRLTIVNRGCDTTGLLRKTNTDFVLLVLCRSCDTTGLLRKTAANNAEGKLQVLLLMMLCSRQHCCVIQVELQEQEIPQELPLLLPLLPLLPLLLPLPLPLRLPLLLPQARLAVKSRLYSIES
jgi:hypothetical protein